MKSIHFTSPKPDFELGDIIQFKNSRHEFLVGEIEGIGRKNYRVLLQDGRFYMVPFRLALHWDGPFDPAIRIPQNQIAITGALLVKLGIRLLQQQGILIPVRFRANVWATYFKYQSHLQFGGRCIRYQFLNGRGFDSVSANIKRFRLDYATPTKLAVLVCHECAHAVVAEKYGRGIKAHGEKFYRELESLIGDYLAEYKSEIVQMIATSTINLS